jgi:hypothetical protein
MRWLLTTRTGVTREDLQRELEPLRVVIDDVAPTPVSDEQVFEADGPGDLPSRLEGRSTSVLKAYPDSAVGPYG